MAEPAFREHGVPLEPVLTATEPAGPEPNARRGRRRLVVEALLSTLVLAALVGALWPTLAPGVTARVVKDGAVLDGDQAALLFPRQGVLAALLAAAGLVQAVLLFPRHRRSGAAVAVTVAVGGLVGALLSWRIGVLLGPDPVGSLKGLAVGTRLEVPLRVDAWGVLSLWAVAALVVVLLLNAWLDDPPARPARHRADAATGPG